MMNSVIKAVPIKGYTVVFSSTLQGIEGYLTLSGNSKFTFKIVYELNLSNHLILSKSLILRDLAA